MVCKIMNRFPVGVT